MLLRERAGGGHSLTGTADADTLMGLAGDDALAGLAGNDTIDGGVGNDALTGGSGNDAIVGGDGTDTAVYAGALADYQLGTSGGFVTITDIAATTDGDDGVDTLAGVETLQFKIGETYALGAPIVLDLDSDGTELVSLGRSSARFDVNGDGRRDRTSWIGKDDAFLFLDRDANGTVSGIGELSFIQDSAGAKSDLEGLAAFDTNGDLKLDAVDASFAGFRLWRDANGNGAAETGEILSLQDAGIVSVGLDRTPTQAQWSWGDAMVLNHSQFFRTDGSTGTTSDVMLAFGAANRSRRPFIGDIFRRGPHGSQLWSREAAAPDAAIEPSPDSWLAAAWDSLASRTLADEIPTLVDWIGGAATLGFGRATRVPEGLADLFGEKDVASGVPAHDVERESSPAGLPVPGIAASGLEDPQSDAVDVETNARRLIEAAARLWGGPAVVHIDGGSHGFADWANVGSITVPSRHMSSR